MNLDEKRLQQVMDEATESGEECGCQLAIFQDGALLCGEISVRREPFQRQKHEGKFHRQLQIFALGSGGNARDGRRHE